MNSVRQNTLYLGQLGLDDSQALQRRRSSSFIKSNTPTSPAISQASTGLVATREHSSVPVSSGSTQMGREKSHLTLLFNQEPKHDSKRVLLESQEGPDSADLPSPYFPSIEVSTDDDYNEKTPFLPQEPSRNYSSRQSQGTIPDDKPKMGSLSHAFFSCFNATSHELLHSLSYLPAVFLGLILNLLDAMSYGYIIFPISNPMFSDFGSDGISMYLVSTFISQIVYGIGSEFRGGNGSMMIEVIPFLHSMVNTIAGHVADERQILPTIMVCYALSSVMTGLVFFLLGLFKLGNIVGFFPRIVLVGTIGVSHLHSF